MSDTTTTATHHGPWCDEDPATACPACTEPFDAPDIDLDAIVAAIVKVGIPAYVEMTGGGVATIYAGEAHDHTETIRFGPAAGETITYKRWQALAGPGWFEGPGYTVARASRTDFYVGPDDEGESDPWCSVATTTDAEIVARIIEQVRS